MAANPARSGAKKSSEPVAHELAPLRLGNLDVPVRLSMWRGEDQSWRGRLIFRSGTDEVTTTDIFCAATETDLWDAVRGLRDHHLRDLYRSLIP